jgi:hypothetical protein
MIDWEITMKDLVYNEKNQTIETPLEHRYILHLCFGMPDVSKYFTFLNPVSTLQSKYAYVPDTTTLLNIIIIKRHSSVDF